MQIFLHIYLYNNNISFSDNTILYDETKQSIIKYGSTKDCKKLYGFWIFFTLQENNLAIDFSQKIQLKCIGTAVIMLFV